MKSEGKAGTRKGRCNYDTGFKLQLAKAACEPGVSIAGLALERGLNANMVHKWRREYLAKVVAAAAQAQPVSAHFLPVTLASVETAIVNRHGPVVPTRAIKPTLPKLPASSTGTIEIKFGGATVRVEGLVDTSVLATILSHFHP